MGTETDPRMTKARSQLIRDHPFYGSLAMELQLVEDENVETMEVDGKNIFYSRKFLDSITQLEIMGTVVHEVEHCVCLHHTRRGDRDPDGWNEACDYTINPRMLMAGFKLPSGHLFAQEYVGMGAEEVYARRRKEGRPTSGRRPGGVRDAAPKQEPTKLAEQEQVWKRRVQQALSVARAANAGTLPGDLQEIAKAMQQSSVDWHDQLHRFFGDKAKIDHSWAVPNPRYMSAGIMLPSAVPVAIEKMGIFFDVSGSITGNMKLVRAFIGEVNSAKELGEIEEIIVVQADTRVRKVDRFTDTIEELEIKGGGGTDFADAFRWFAENEPDVAAILVFTDLCTASWGKEPDCPVLWVAYGYESNVERLAKQVPFGEVIHIKD